MSERVYAILAQIMGGFVFSAIVGSITTVVTNMDRSRAAQREKVAMISTYVRDKELPSLLRIKVLAFFRQQRTHAWNEREILQARAGGSPGARLLRPRAPPPSRRSRVAGAAAAPAGRDPGARVHPPPDQHVGAGAR